MRIRRAVGLGVALAALGTGSAQAADELSVTQRLADRREVAAGTRAQVLGFQDGRFYANGWHTTGEMGGIVTPPLKLLDSVSFGIDGAWIGAATKFTSGWGYARYDLPATAGIELRRIDVAPDGRRGALLGLKMTNPSRHKRTVEVMVDAHSELMTQFPWGFDPPPGQPEVSPTRATTRPTPAPTTAARSSSATPGSSRARTRTTPTRRSSGRTGAPRAATPAPATTARSGRGACARRTRRRRRCRAHATTARSGAARAGSCAIACRWAATAPRRCGSRWPARRTRRARPARSSRRLTHRPERLAAEKIAARRALARHSRVRLPGDPALQESLEWGKQNLADLTQTAEDVDLRWSDEAKEWTPVGSLRRMTWIGAGFPDYPWLFGVDGEYTAHAAVTLGQFEAIEDHMRALRDISDQLSDRSGVVVHEVVADGSIWHGKDNRVVNPGTGAVTYDFNTDEIVKFPAAVALIWRWTGDDRFRDEMLDFTWRGLEYVRTKLDDDADGWPQGNGNVEREGMGTEKLDNAVYYIRGLYDFADMARSAGQTARADAAEARADELASRFEATWWIEADQAYGDSLDDETGAPINQKHWIGATPMEAELKVGGEVVPGLASFEHGTAALATREDDCYSGERPGNRGLFHTGCGGGPTGAGEFGIFSLNSGIMAVGEGNYARLGAEQQARYTGANAETQFSQPITAGTPDEQPGAMPEIMPSEPSPDAPEGATGTPPNIDRCWTCRSMFMQAWGHYGTAWSVVHQQLGVRPDLGHGRLEVMPQVPDGQPSVQGADIRLGRGSADVLASHDGARYTTVTDTGDVRLRTFQIGHTLPSGSEVASVVLDGRPVRDYDARDTSRGLELRVAADPRKRHTLVVTTAG